MFALFVLYKDNSVLVPHSYGANGKKLQHYSTDVREDKPETIRHTLVSAHFRKF